ncbi:hypothetical protein RUM44_012815 [Polyplax serrata]|uniref:Uncharacterized protein n=1 Tax=Polyplax serrata TaxID=468196 RepID=A0ABR1BCD6_POLSC
MESSLREELEATKSALKLETIRCCQLVAVFTRKLHEKEMELRASKDLRDQQLSRLLRALIILESRLKKEQKLIRQQLAERDLLIEKQEREISKYRQSEMDGKWNKMHSEDSEVKNNVIVKPALTTGEERLDNLCKGLLPRNSKFCLQKVRSEGNEKVLENHESKDVDSIKKEGNTFKDNPVLESVNQILLKDEEELLVTSKPVSIALTKKDKINDAEASEWYETNSNAVLDDQLTSSVWCLPADCGEEMSGRKDVLSSPPIKSQHHEEKACLEMSKKNLTVVDLEGIDSKTIAEGRAVSPVKSTASYEEIIPVLNSNYKSARSLQKPPALPPKPAHLLKPHQILQQQNGNCRSQQHPTAENKDLPKLQPRAENHASRSPPNSFNKPVPSKKPSTNAFKQMQTNTYQLYQEVKPIKLTSDGDKIHTKSSLPSSRAKKNEISCHVPNSTDFSTNCRSQFGGKQMNNEEHVGNCTAIKIGSSVSSLITGLSGETIVTELNGDQVSPSSTDETHVSQLVRQFEVLGKYERPENEANDIRQNFEEFKLEESYREAEEDGRRDGDGAENKNLLNYYATLTIVPPTPKESLAGTELDYRMYESFLENTGLSQKSILTPSRMLSNHRSCLKPKDVKHRNRVKAAAAIEKCNVSASNGGSTVKYWTEPYL